MPATAVAGALTLLASVAGTPVCQVKVVLAGRLLAVMLVRSMVCVGQLLVMVVALNTGASTPVGQSLQIS